MMACDRIAAVLLAAGRGMRFGGNKLEAILGDTMLGLHAARTLAEMQFGSLFAVHDPSHGALAAAFTDHRFTLIDNDDPSAGLSHSLALAAEAALTTDADALLICLGDMPFVTRAHLLALIGADGDEVVASADQQRIGIGRQRRFGGQCQRMAKPRRRILIIDQRESVIGQRCRKRAVRGIMHRK